MYTIKNYVTNDVITTPKKIAVAIKENVNDTFKPVDGKNICSVQVTLGNKRIYIYEHRPGELGINIFQVHPYVLLTEVREETK